LGSPTDAKTVVKRKMKFLRKYGNSENDLCKLFADACQSGMQNVGYMSGDICTS